MFGTFNRRSLVKSAAAAGAISTAYAMPNVISGQGTNIELNYWHVFNREVHDQLVAEFNAQDTGITVQATGYGSYEEVANSVLTGLQSGDVPDISVVSDVWWFPLYLRQILADLTPYIQDADDFVQPLFVEYQRNGGQFALPLSRSTPIFFYNAAAFETAGLDESVLATWSDFREAAPLLVDDAGMLGSFGFGSVASYGAWSLHGPVWAFGGNYSDADFNILINQPEAVATGEFMREMLSGGKALAVTDPFSDFAAGTIGAMVTGNGNLARFEPDMDVQVKTAQLPEEVMFGAPTGGAGLGALRNESEEIVAAAAEFLNFMTSTESATKWSLEANGLPIRNSVIESEDYQAFLKSDSNNQIAIDQLPKTQPQDSARVFIPNGDSIIGGAWDRILVGDTPAQEAFDEAAALLEEAKAPVLEALEAIEG